MKPERIAIKIATAEMIKGCGGLETSAMFCRVSKTVLSENQSLGCPSTFVAIDVVQDLEPLARDRDGWPHVTRALAAGLGFALVRLPESLPSDTDLLLLLAKLTKEGGDIASAICAALADHVVTPTEARETRKQVREQIEVAVQLDAVLAAIEAEGGR
ncbi:phage regulatory CII family protein [Sphingomonas sp. PAMC 26605]|uniref:phage regulatory CII family protein n=1 Tax=Sphingomonas sp. PAMC 26605 TaxID=1112214 RepID=UPI00026CD688|nr:phage regulatory CII family protein [Sphingomonas sp. PAMC 26605]